MKMRRAKKQLELADEKLLNKFGYKSDGYDYLYLKCSNSSEVLITLTEPCLFNLLSSDHTAQSSLRANAKYSASSESGHSSSASDRYCLNSRNGTKFILDDMSDRASIKAYSGSPALDEISCLCFSHSFNKNSGANSLRLSENNKSRVLPPLEMSADMIIFASITSSIQYAPGYACLYLACRDLFIVLPSSSASLFVSFDFDKIDLSIFKCANFSRIASLATSDQLISLASSISPFNSAGIDKVIVGIFINLQTFNTVYTVHAVKVYKPCHLNESDSTARAGNNSVAAVCICDENEQKLKTA